MQSYGFRARCADIDKAKGIASKMGATPGGKDNQVDTYFPTPKGYLKVKEASLGGGQLIFYDRDEDLDGIRVTRYETLRVPEALKLKNLLSLALDVRAEIRKVREIYNLPGGKIYIDVVDGLGTFISLEVQETPGDSEEELITRARELKRAFDYRPEDRVKGSYADIYSEKKMSR